MAPSSDDKDNKYADWKIEDLKTECSKRKLKFKEDDSKRQLIDMLIKDDNKPPHWGKIYSRILFHTGMTYEEIARRTIPQIMEILDGAEENISIKMGISNIFGSSPQKTHQSDGKPPKLSQFQELANLFSAIK